jgi:predicted NUDIX family phosphoesterase
MDRSKQLILCVEAETLKKFNIAPAEQLVLNNLSWLDSIPCWFVPRSLAEEDPRFRQLIPYIVLANTEGKIAVYRRGATGGEARLHDRLTLGFGGHVDVSDAFVVGEEFDAKMTLQMATQREIQEELATRITVKDVVDVGLIISDADDVSRVHLGLVQVWTIDSSIEAGEACILDIEWHTVQDLISRKDRMENWSRIVCEALANTVVST